MKINLRSAMSTAGLLALGAVATVTNAAILASEVIVVVGSSVQNLLADWRDEL